MNYSELIQANRKWKTQGKLDIAVIFLVVSSTCVQKLLIVYDSKLRFNSTNVLLLKIKKCIKLYYLLSPDGGSFQTIAVHLLNYRP